MRPPWVRMIDEADDRVFYYNGSTKISTFTTPHLPEYKKLLRQRRQRNKQDGFVRMMNAIEQRNVERLRENDKWST